MLNICIWLNKIFFSTVAFDNDCSVAIKTDNLWLWQRNYVLKIEKKKCKLFQWTICINKYLSVNQSEVVVYSERFVDN